MVTCQEEDEIEMEDSQKKILEDKVYNLIEHWNDMDYIKNYHESFFSPEKKVEPEKVIEEKKFQSEKKEDPQKIIPPKPKNIFMIKEKNQMKNKNLRSATKSKRKMVSSGSKFFKNPVMIQEANKAT